MIIVILKYYYSCLKLLMVKEDGVAGKSSLASMICTFNLHEIVKDINVYTIFVPFAKDILSLLVVAVLVHNPIYVKL